MATPILPSATGASIHVGFASTPPPGDYRFVRLHESGRAEIREVLTVNGPGPWLTYEGVVSVPPATARAILRTADPTHVTNAPPPLLGAPCVLGLASGTGVVWQGCADGALARRVLADVPRLTPAALGIPCTTACLRGATRSEHSGQAARALRSHRAGHRDQREWRLFVRHRLAGPTRDAERPAGRARTRPRRRCRRAVQLARFLDRWVSAATSWRRWPRRERRGRAGSWRRLDESSDAAGHVDIDPVGTHRHTTAPRVSSGAGRRGQVAGGP